MAQQPEEQHTAPLIRSAEIDDLDTLVDTLSDAFAHDPVFNWLFPDTELYAELFRLILSSNSLPKGMVHLEQNGRGAAAWLPPDCPFNLVLSFDLLALIARCLWRMGPGTIKRLRQQSSLFDQQKPSQAHFHLQFIGCRQRDQGQGIGAKLLQQGTRTCDALQSPAYLECSSELNLPLYERHGFVIRDETKLPEGGPRVWFMWREAQNN